MTTTLDRNPQPPPSGEPAAARAGYRPRLRTAPHPGGMPAGRALQIMVGALLTAMVFNSAAMVRAGEGMEPGLTRTLVLAVGRPVHTVAHALWLDRPRRVLGWVFHSNPPAGGSSPLLSAPGPGGPTTPGPASSPAATPTGKPTAEPTGRRAPAVAAPTRTPSAANPLRLLVAGDSMTEFLGPALLKATSAGGRVAGRTVTRYGTGLARPDFFDWAREAGRLMSAPAPEAVVVMLGGNDGQSIRLSNGKILGDGSAPWAAEYQRRAAIVMRKLTAGGARRVYWISMPVPRSPRLVRDYAQLNGAVSRAAAALPAVRYVDVATRLSSGGQYAAYLPDDNGRTVQARARDGIHLSRDGARIAAGIVARALDADWHLRQP